jgi:hypothetical protein
VAGLLEDGRLRNAGVSNFQPWHLDRIVSVTGAVPVVNQIEVHPYFANEEARAGSAEHGVAVEAWSPLSQGRLLGDPVIESIAAAAGKTPAQVVLRWHIQQGLIVFPKSTRRTRIEENVAIFDFELAPADVAAINGLSRGPQGREGPDPDKFDWIPAGSPGGNRLLVSRGGLSGTDSRIRAAPQQGRYAVVNELAHDQRGVRALDPGNRQDLSGNAVQVVGVRCYHMHQQVTVPADSVNLQNFGNAGERIGNLVEPALGDPGGDVRRERIAEHRWRDLALKGVEHPPFLQAGETRLHSVPGQSRLFRQRDSSRARPLREGEEHPGVCLVDAVAIGHNAFPPRYTCGHNCAFCSIFYAQLVWSPDSVL